MMLAPSTTAIIVVDKVNEAGRALTDVARRCGTPVIYAKPIDQAATSGRAFREFPARREVRRETWGGTFSAYEPAASEPVVVMHRDSAFFETCLDSLLGTLGTRTLVVTGVATNLGVETTAREGYQREYNVIVLSDCTAALTAAEHRVGLRNVMRGSGTVAESRDIIDAWQTAAAR